MALSRKPPGRDFQSELQVCLGKRDYKTAVTVFEEMFKQGNPSSQIRMRYGDTLMLAGKKGDAIREYFKVAEQMAETGYLVQAVAVYKKIVKLDPSHTGVLERLARLDAERAPARAQAPVPGRPATIEIDESAPSMDLDIGAGLDLGARDQRSAASPAAATPAPAPSTPRAAPAPAPAPPARPAATPVPAPRPTSPPAPSPFEISRPDPAPAPAFEFEFATAPAKPAAPAAASAGTSAATPQPAPLAGIADTGLAGFEDADIDSMLDGILSDVGSQSSAPSHAQLKTAETHIGLFAHLAIDELVEVLKLLDWRAVRAGDVIVRQGEPGNSMFIVSSGKVEATRDPGGGGAAKRIAALGDGEFFGEMAVLSGERRSATVTALESSELLELSRERLQKLQSQHPEIEAKLRLAHDERKERNRAAGLAS